MSLTDARHCPWPIYTAMFQELNYRHDPDRDKGPDAPDEAFVLEQMELLKAQGVRVN